MSNLSESSTWESNINQVENGEAITGGSGGRANIATGQLANRTTYLKSSLVDWDIVSSATTMATTPEQIILNEGITYTLKATPSAGDCVRIAVGGDWSTTNSTVARNGSNIMGDGTDLVLDTNRAFCLTYKDATQGWVLS